MLYTTYKGVIYQVYKASVRCPLVKSPPVMVLDTRTPNVCKTMAFGALCKVWGHRFTYFWGPGMMKYTGCPSFPSFGGWRMVMVQTF